MLTFEKLNLTLYRGKQPHLYAHGLGTNIAGTEAAISQVQHPEEISQPAGSVVQAQQRPLPDTCGSPLAPFQEGDVIGRNFGDGGGVGDFDFTVTLVNVTIIPPEGNPDAQYPEYLYFSSYHHDYDLAQEQGPASIGYPGVMIQNQIGATAGDPLSTGPPPPPYALPQNPALRLLCLNNDTTTLVINRDIATLLPKESLYVGVYSAPYQVEKVYPGGSYWNFGGIHDTTALGAGWVLNPEDFSNQGAFGEYIFRPAIDGSSQEAGFRVEIALACPACADAFGTQTGQLSAERTAHEPLDAQYTSASGLGAEFSDDRNGQPALSGLNIFNYDTIANAAIGPVPLLSRPDANISCTACYLQVQSMELYMSVVYDAAHNGFAEVATQVDVTFGASLGVSMFYSSGTSSTGLSQFMPLVTDKILAQFQVFALGIALQPLVTADLSQQTSMGWDTPAPMRVTSGVQTTYQLSYGYSYNWTVGPYVFTEYGSEPSLSAMPTAIDGLATQASWSVRLRPSIRVGLTGDTDQLTWNQSQGSLQRA
ncbi:hypothetical protein WJX84_011706 [Apatococcus fuscideae]|uniref:Uncharacterized protein n=1 Tax=Apatococcus fuscideae TaxID=2026836 RepID=A0AAW1SI52_9CHLO